MAEAWRGKSGRLVWRRTDDGLPVAFATALLLGVGWTGAGIAGLAKVAWKMLLWGCSAIGKTNVVTISGLVGASHYGTALASCRPTLVLQRC